MQTTATPNAKRWCERIRAAGNSRKTSSRPSTTASSTSPRRHSATSRPMYSQTRTRLSSAVISAASFADRPGGAEGMPKNETDSTGIFDIKSIADSLPDNAATLLVDRYLTNREQASARVFRVYRPTPAHYHATCDEYLYVFSGRGTFWMRDAATKAEFRPGQLLFFKRGTVHAMPELLERPVVFLSVDTPRREPTDIIFVDPKDGSPATFMERNAARA